MIDRSHVESILMNKALVDDLAYFASEVSDIVDALCVLHHEGQTEPVTYNDALAVADRLTWWAESLTISVEVHRSRWTPGGMWLRARANPYALALPADCFPIIWFTREPTPEELALLHLITNRR